VAERLLRRVQPEHPEDFWINFKLAGALFRKRPAEPAEAAGFYRAALAVRPHSAAAYNNLGLALRAQGKLAEAESAFQRAIALQPDDADAHDNLGIALHNQGKLKEAEAAHRRAIELKPDDAGAHNNLGVTLLDQGQVARAMAAFRKAIELETNFGGAYNNLGNAFAALGKFSAALAAHRKALELGDDQPTTHLNIAEDLRRLGKPADSEMACWKAIELASRFAGAYYSLGLALHNQRKLAGAERAYRKAIELQANHSKAYHNLGLLLMEQGKLADAEAAYREAIKHNPKSAEAYYNLGLLLSRQGKLEGAEAAYHKAIALQPDYAEAHCNLGSVLQKQGRFTEALAARKRGHKLGCRRDDWPFPSAEWVRTARRLVALDARLAKVLSGEGSPAGTGETIALAQLCQVYKKRYATAARFYAEAFAAQPKLAAPGGSYDAARAAALAGCGKGKDAAGLPEMERRRLRKQALDWLRADLNAWCRVLEKRPAKARPVIVGQMQHWLTDTDFAGVGGPDALAKLPEAERPAWRKLWADVADTQARARQTTPPKKQPGKQELLPQPQTDMRRLP
jgi:Flp pilus assembly protein TadD